MSTTLLGLPTIRAFNVQAVFTDLFFQAQDEHTKSWFTFMACAGWLGFRLELLCLAFIGFVVFICIIVAGLGMKLAIFYFVMLCCYLFEFYIAFRLDMDNIKTQSTFTFTPLIIAKCCKQHILITYEIV